MQVAQGRTAIPASISLTSEPMNSDFAVIRFNSGHRACRSTRALLRRSRLDASASRISSAGHDHFRAV